MTDDEPTGSCPTCFRRDPRTPLICDVDRSKLRSWLGDIPALFVDLQTLQHDGINGQSAGGRVSGSKEKQLPILVDPLDLAAPARNVWLLGEDQVGYVSVASTLDFWVRDWREARGGREGLPEPYVPALASWLLRRVDDACDAHPAIDEAFQDIRRVHGALRGQLGLREPKREECIGIPCPAPDCDLKTLYRLPEGTFVECDSCGRLFTMQEYDEWCRTLLAEARKKNVRPAA